MPPKMQSHRLQTDYFLVLRPLPAGFSPSALEARVLALAVAFGPGSRFGAFGLSSDSAACLRFFKSL